MANAKMRESSTSGTPPFHFPNAGTLLQNIVENAAVPTFLVGTDGQLFYANHAFCSLLGYEPDEIIGLGIAQIVHPDDAGKTREQAAALVAGEIKGYSAERRYLSKNGNVIWMLASAAPLLDESTGKVLYITVQAVDINRQKQAEMALADSESRWNFALESAGQGVWDFDFRNGLAFYSRTWRVMRGIDPAEEIDPSVDLWLNRVHPDDRERLRMIVRQQDAGEIPLNSFEYRERHRDGHYIWILSRGRPVEWFPDGRPARFTGTDTDITSLKNTEENLKSISAFHNLVIENIPAMVFVKDAKEHRFILVNRAAEQLLGIDRSELIGKNDFDFFPKEQAELFIDRDKEVFKSGKLQITPEEPINTRHNGVRLLHTTKIPVLDEQGQPLYLVALCQDITERRHAETALQTSEAMFRGLLAASPDVVIVVDQTGRILLTSQQVESVFGYTSEELAGQSINMLLPERYRKLHAVHINGFVKKPEGRNMATGKELSALHKDGSEFPIEISLNQNRISGNPVVIAAVRDITDRKAIEKQLRQSQKMEAIGNLTGGVAHDFNNLLGIIVGNLDLLRGQLNGGVAIGPKIDQLASEALEAALRGADLTKRLLAYARRQPLRPQPIDVNELVGGISKLLNRTLGEDIEIRLNLGAAVWPINADPSQLGASLINIGNNARDAMPKGGVLTIATSNKILDADFAMLHDGIVPGNYTQIEMRDTGTGIAPEILNQIFEPFFTTKEQGKGTGLGLSMVFGFVKQSAGHIDVYSEVGHGTTFRLYLPRAMSAADVPESVAVSEQGGNETILAVEDNEGLRRIVVRQLNDLGYRVLEAKDGNAAVKILESEPVDLLFTDIKMPGGMDGYTLARNAVSRWSGLKVLLTSGFPETKLDGNDGAQVNMQLLTKPYRKDDLARALRNVLDAR
jgi:PAS domain S-box-containing protein